MVSAEEKKDQPQHAGIVYTMSEKVQRGSPASIKTNYLSVVLLKTKLTVKKKDISVRNLPLIEGEDTAEKSRPVQQALTNLC